MENLIADCTPSAYEMEQLAPYFPKERGKKRINDSHFITAIRLHLKHGAAWRMIPSQLGNWKTIYSRFKRWFCDKGAPLSKLLFDKALQKADFSAVMMDSTCCKCVRTASSFFVKKKERDIGQTKGGYNTKIHLLCDNNGYPFDFVTTKGQVSDIKAAEYFEDTLYFLPHKGWFLADKGYDSHRWRERCNRLGYKTCIPYRDFGKNKTEATKQRLYERIDKDPWHPERNQNNRAMYAKRNRVERGIGRLKDIDHIAFRKCRSAAVFNGFINFTLLFQFWLTL